MKTRIVALCALLLTVFTPGAATAAPATPPIYRSPVTTVATGPLSAPVSIAVDTNGTLYIVEFFNNRIQKITFTPDGTPTTTIVAETGAAGNVNIQLNYPYGVAVDSDGNLYIADTENNRVQKVTFNPDGTTAAPTTVAGGTLGNGTNELNNPSGITFDSNEDLYIADSDNHRIQKITFNTNGTTTPTTVAGGTLGSGTNELNNPFDITIDSNGDLYIADTQNHRIQKTSFNVGGTPTTTTVAGTGTSGNGTNQLALPHGVAVDSNGDLYIADSNNHRIQKVTFDRSHPTINTTDTTTKVGAAKIVNYACNDADSGINTCTATLDGQPVNNGDPIPTNKRGTQTLVVTAIDGAGNTTTKTVSITIHGKHELTGAYKNTTGTNASVARLYLATFKRAPEGKGFDFWLTAHDNGKTLQAMANFFVAGKEFGIIYGKTTNADFVDLMYQNVMGRTPNAEAKTFWLNELNTSNRTRAQMLLWFSESKEFKILTYTS